MLDVTNKLKPTADQTADSCILGHRLDNAKSSPVRARTPRSDTAMKNVDAIGLETKKKKEHFQQLKPAMKDKALGIVNTDRLLVRDLKASNTVALNRIALSKFLNDLREEVTVNDSVFGEIQPTKDFEGPEKRGKDRHAKGILSKEFGKDGDKLKMKIIEEDVVIKVSDNAEKKVVGEEEGRKARETTCSPRKVSFKVNGSRRNKPVESRVVLNSSKVAALASKYNSLVNNVDTSKANDGTIVIKTPNQKQDIKVVVSRKNSNCLLKRDNNSSTSAVKNAGGGGGKRLLIDDVTLLPPPKKTGSVKCKSRSGNVRAAIQIFEQNSTIIRVKTTGTVNKDEKMAAKDKENVVKMVTSSEEEERSKSLVPRFSTLYKDYNKEFRRKDDKCSAVENSPSLEARKKIVPDVLLKSENSTGSNDVSPRRESSSDDAKCGHCKTDLAQSENGLVENKSVLYGGGLQKAVKTKDCRVCGRGDKEAEEREAKEGQRGRVDRRTEEGGYEVVLTSVSKQSTTSGRKISKITKKVITFPAKTKSESLGTGSTQNGHVVDDSRSEKLEKSKICSNEKLTTGRDDDGLLEDYEKIDVLGSSNRSDAGDFETLTRAEIYERIFPVGVATVPTPAVRPNTSFLWGSPPRLPPLPRLPTSSPDIEIPDMYAYDDVYPPAATNLDSSLHYSSVKIEDIYDDIGDADAKEVGVQRSVSNVSYDVIGGQKVVQVIVTSEAGGVTTAEGYDYVSSRRPPAYQDAEDNIYDDVKTMSMKEDTMSISNCYESIYEGVNGSTKEAVNSLYGGKEAVSSGDSSASGKSFCEQNNSLYGGLLGPRFESCSGSQASTVSVEDGPHEVLSYQLTSLGVTRSDTSDEWVDLEPSDSEPEQLGTINLVVQHERSRCRRSPSWSQKVRRQWSKSPRSYAGAASVFVSSASVHYLGELQSRFDGKTSNALGPYRTKAFAALRAIIYNGDIHETQEMTFFLDREGADSSDDSDHHYEMLDDIVDKSTAADVRGGIDQSPFDDFDSFDSDSSTDERRVAQHPEGYNTRLPDPPAAAQNIYGITKIAEAAGNKLLKLRKSLSKMRPKRHTTEIRLSSGAGPPPLSTVPPSPPLEKTTSSGNLSNKKYWSLRKFKRSSSTLDQTASSTFYITDAVDVDTGQREEAVDHKRNSVVSESSEQSNGHETSAASPSSSKARVSEVGVDIGARRNSRPTPTSGPAPVYERRPSARPNSPPPLPPPLVVNTESAPAPKRPNRKDKRSTSWYAECGLFDGTEPSATVELKRNANKERSASNSWYAEVGLWDETNGSGQPNSLTHEPDFNNSADASDCSVSPENSGAERRFNDEPLYQFYTASIVELARRDSSGEFDSDGYEEIGDRGIRSSARPTAMELIQPREGLHRTLWCQIPEVISSRVLSTINPHQKKLQEAKFEIITSEASYVKSLNVLERHFISSAEFGDESVLSKSDRRILFSNVTPVKNCSKRFLAELEKCWQDNILLNGICDVIYKYATDNFNSYVKYCSNQIYRDRTLRRLKDQHGKFADALTQLESTPGCQSLSLHSFLMLPMQRITRLPLLVDAVLTRLDAQDDEYPNCKMALATLNKIVKDCNEGARRMERMEEILILSRQLDFPREIRAVPIISSTRWLVRSGELTQLVFRGDEAKLTFGKKFSKSALHFFLFTDLLVITKKKSEECYVVTDYCPRNMVQMSSGEGLTHLPVRFSTEGGRNLMLLTMLQNHEKKTVEMVLSCAVESDRQRWLQATSQPTSDNPDESVYEEWDCPQVTTVHPFTAGQPDELALDISDVVNVFRKTPDGWYHGERMRDGEQGWFPGNYTVEVASAHVRARNLKQRYRLLALSANYLDSQRKDKK